MAIIVLPQRKTSVMIVSGLVFLNFYHLKIHWRTISISKKLNFVINSACRTH